MLRQKRIRSPQRSSLRMLTIREVANYLSLSERTIYRLIEDGILPALKIGGQWRFEERTLEDWVATEINNHKKNCTKTPPLLEGGEG